MITKKLQTMFVLAALLLAGAIPVFGMAQDINIGLKQQPVIITNADVPVTCLTRSMARNIWSFRIRSWPDYRTIKLVSFNNDNQNFLDFAEFGLNYRPYQLSRTWEKAATLGFGSPFKTVESASQMVEMVGNNSAAIGFLFPEDLAKLQSRRIKTLTILDDQHTNECMAKWIRIQKKE